MPVSAKSEVINVLLARWRSGHQDALDELIPLVHKELRHMARRHMRLERPGNTLQPTALVNEVYLRLLGLKQIQWNDREHFFALSASLMRRILVDAARARQTKKRGANAITVPLDGIDIPQISPDNGLLELENALKKLEAVDPRKARVLELRCFGGLGVEESARVIGVSPRTVKRDWLMAKAWLSAELSKTR
jgi:RNA polymerase sigma-70 factor, ECF subfamily